MSDPVSSLTRPGWGKTKIKLPSLPKSDKQSNKDTTKPDHSVRFLALGILLILILVLGVGFYLVKYGNPFARGNADQAQADAVPLEIEVIKPTRDVYNSRTELTVITNKEVTIPSSNRTQLIKIGELNSKLYYIIRVDNLPIDTTKIIAKFSDKAGNTKEQELAITRKPFALPAGMTVIEDWPNSEYTLDGDKYDAKTDKQHRLLEDYEPNDIVDLNKDLGLYTLNNAQLRAVPARALKSMLDDLAKATGKYVTIASGYRSFTVQMQTYTSWVKQLGEQKADGLSAKPGHSEHQLGTTVDFVSQDTNWQITNDFGNTVAGKWLSENSYKYGFVQPYKTDQSQTGGYKEESWHFRFTGIPEPAS